MSKGVDKTAVFQTTKVRTKFRDDNSWLQRRSEPEPETEEVKPWIAEVRASRMEGAPIETSPVSSPVKPAPSPVKPEAERAPTSGYLIRGILTKPDKPASTTASTTNGISAKTQFTKKPSEAYKKIAPYTVRPASENQEGQLSNEEQEKRTEAASNVLRKSAPRQRSYVLSAAKKYESAAETPINNTVSFVAKRVEITDDDETAASPPPASSPPPSPGVPVTSAASAPQPSPRKKSDAVDKVAAELVAPAAVVEVKKEEEEKAAPEPVKEDPPTETKDPFEDQKPGCTKVATPLPVLLPEFIETIRAEPEPENSGVSGKDDAPLVDLAPVSVTPKSPEPVLPAPLSPAPLSPVPVSLTPVSPPPVSPEPVSLVPVSTVTEILVKTEPEFVPEPEPEPEPEPQPKPVPVLVPVPVPRQEVELVLQTETEPEQKQEPEPQPEPVPEQKQEVEPEPEPKPSSRVETLAALYDTLIPFDSTSPSLKDDEPALAEEERGPVDSRAAEDGAEEEPAPEHSNCVPITDDLLALTGGPEPESAEPVPPSPGRWSQDLLGGGLDSESTPAKPSSTLDLLSNDVIVINTRAPSLSVQREEEKPTDETAKETQSSTETVTVTTKTVIITDKSEQEDSADPWGSHVTTTTTVTESSSADPFDPYPIGTTSPNRASDLLQPVSDVSINSVTPTFMENKEPRPETNMSGNALESLADNVIPINTDAPSISTRRSWATTWETSTPQQTHTEEEEEEKSREADPEGQAGDQKTVIMFERKSSENDSPWDRWTSPSVYTITTTTGEEEEEEEEGWRKRKEVVQEESTRYTETETVTTYTTIRETRTETEPAMDRYGTYSRTVIEEDPREPTPEPDKKGFVFVKEYVNATETSLHNARDYAGSGSDYLTSQSTSYYTSPSRVSLSSTCNFCGQLVGNDAKITIEHLNINCHPSCFMCATCSRPMGDLLSSMYLHDGKVLCESCYSKALD